MYSFFRNTCVLLTIFFIQSSFSQSKENLKKKDSLIRVLNTTDSLELKASIHFKLYGINRRFSPNKAVEHLYKYLSLNKEIGDESKVCLAYSQIGWSYLSEVEQLDSAKIYLTKALQLAKKLNDSIRLGSAYTFLGFMNQRKGFYRTAMEHYFKSLDYKTPINEPNRLGFSYNLIGKTYELQNQLDKSLEFHFKALNERKKIKTNGSVAHSYQNIGEVYYKMKDYKTSINYYNKALKIRRQQNNQKHLAICYNGLAKNYIDTDSLVKAKTILNLTIKYSDSIEAPFQKAKALNSLSKIEIKKGNYKTAENYALKGNKIAKSRGYRDILMHNYELLSNLYSLQNKPSLSLKNYKYFSTLKDSIVNQESLRDIAELEGIYNTEKQDKKILKLQQEQVLYEQKQRTKTIITYGILIGFSILLLLAWLYLKRRKLVFNQRLELKEQENEIVILKLAKEEAKTVHYSEELNQFTHLIINKNDQIKKLQAKIENLPELKKYESEVGSKLHQLYNTTILTSEDWRTFRGIFSQVHPKFIENISILSPSISSGEIKIATLLKLNLSNKEMSSILGISSESVRKSKYRLRKKLNFESDKDLQNYVSKI